MSSPPSLPDHAALLLDLDGTLLDFAPTPDQVVVPPTLPETLLRLRRKLGEALAIVTGRPLTDIDRLLPGVPYAVAGEHGGAVRRAPDAEIERAAAAPVPAAWLEAGERMATETPGVLLERKTRGFVMHYRLAPDQGPPLRRALLAMLEDGGDGFVMLSAHMAWEIKPRGADKGTAVATLLERPPFVGRVPVYIGDDVTDEDGMRVAREHGGLGLRVQDVFGDPAGVRAWLASRP